METILEIIGCTLLYCAVDINRPRIFEIKLLSLNWFKVSGLIFAGVMLIKYASQWTN